MEWLAVASQIGLWVLVLLQALITVVLARQIGLLHVRLGPAPARMLPRGPVIGEPLAQIHGATLDGRATTLGAPSGEDALLVFVTPTCPACKTLIPGLRTMAAAERKRIDVTVVSVSADPAGNKQYADQLRSSHIAFVVAPEAAAAYRATPVPQAVLTDGEGVVRAKGVVNHLEHLESLLLARETGYSTWGEYLETRNLSIGMRHDLHEFSDSPPVSWSVAAAG
jgi:methylamine dehydrogenase accessory protein MauD